MDFTQELKALKPLFRDSEKQLIEFDSVIPFDKNPTNIYSPKLVNLMLQVGPQIESLTDLIGNQLSVKFIEKGLRSRINQLNSDGLLTSFEITTLPHDKKITPFSENLEWWESYNKTKHELSKFQFKVTYLTVMDALAVLASLHRLAAVCTISDENTRKLILEKKYWNPTFELYHGNQSPSRPNFLQGPWKSDLFKISTYFVYMTGY